METEISDAMAAINRRQESLVELRREELRGEQGPRGEKGDPCVCREPRDGKDGADGHPGADGTTPELMIGSVTTGDNAAAFFRRDANGVYLLNLVLPKAEKGERGAASTVPGIQGRPGRDGLDGRAPTSQEVETIVNKVLEAKTYRGESGPQGERGDIGPQGNAGLSEEDIRKVVIAALSDAGVITEQTKKLVMLRAKIHEAVHKADIRHQEQVVSIVKQIDELF